MPDNQAIDVPPLDLTDPKLLSAVLEAANDAIVMTEAAVRNAPHPRIVYANEAYLRMSGYELSEVIGQSPRILQGPGTCRATLDRIRKRLEAWEPFREKVLNYRKDGTPFWVELNVRPFADETGLYKYWVSVQRDVTAQHKATEDLSRHARDLEEAHRLAKLGTWRWLIGSPDISISGEVASILGIIASETPISVSSVQSFIEERDQQNVRNALDRITLLGEIATLELGVKGYGSHCRTVWIEGHPERDSNGTIIAARGLIQDVTAHRNNEKTLLWNTTHDSLTGLFNMDGLRSQVSAIVARARATQGVLLLGLVDLDHLKLLNDTLGHAVGDAIIVEASERLKNFFRKNTCIARLGGDEFIFLTCTQDKNENLHEQLQELIDIFKKFFYCQGRELDCSGSIGVVVSEDLEPCLDTLLRNADMAMYRAKEAGRGGFAFFSSDLQSQVSLKVEHLDLARLAVGSKLVVPHYQPKVSLLTGEHVGFEALLRLQIGNRVLPPSTVEYAFEHVELATRLGDEMLRRVLEQIRQWRQEGFAFGSVAVNVSGAELLRPCYTERVLQALGRADVPAGALELEITEGVLMGRGAERVATTITHLREAGVRIMLDDFGTGYASLTHLKSLPISGIKIDKSFVSDMLEDESDASIVRALIGLAAELSIDLVAEGVETEEQAEFLRKYGCRVAQGYLFGRPISAADIWRRGATADLASKAIS